MNTKNIKLLIEKYFEGSTTVAEEQMLKAYFTSENIAPEHHRYITLFSLLDSESSKQAPATLHKKLEQLFDDQPAKPFYRRRQMLWYFSGIAAAIALLLAIFLTIENQPAPSQQLTGAQREEVLLAYNQTKATLTFVAQNFAKGTQPLEKIEKLETGQEAFQKLGKLDRKLNQMSTNMQTFSSQIEHLHQLSKFNIINN